MTDSTRRAVRTFGHGIVAAAFSLPILLASLPTPPGRVGVILGTVVAACAVVAKIVNYAEDNLPWWPAFLKAPASEGEHPVPDAGHGDAGGLLYFALVALVIVMILVLVGVIH